MQNEESWSQDGKIYSIHSYYSCPILQVGTEEGQGKITNTKSAFEASQKTAMIDCVEGSASIQKSQNRDRPRIGSSQEVI